MPGEGRCGDKPKYSFIVPIFNEEAVIPALIERLSALLRKLDGPSEVILVNDGSRDGSLPLLLEANRRDPRLKVASLSRNFGHQTAITAGADLAAGDAVIIIDADLQDPPEVVLEMVERWKQGYDVVYGLRAERRGESFFKRITARVFYRLLDAATSTPIAMDVGDFRLVDRRALDAFRGMREHNRFVRGMFSWVGLRQTAVSYVREARAAGSTKYPLARMLRLAFDALIGFSDLPLRLSIWIGALVSLGAILYALYAVVLWATGQRNLVPGWASTVVVIAFLGGVNLIMTGIVGLYVGRIHEEVKNRPLYIVESTAGFDQLPRPPRAVFLEGER
ncbi:MAG: glycosyltransferase family 2 protein [Bryobacteraceae bacterium]